MTYPLKQDASSVTTRLNFGANGLDGAPRPEKKALAGAAPAAPACTAKLAKGQALRLLVVDDEEPQRRIVAEILDAAGYQVETAGGLLEAIRRVEQGGVDVVLTDLKMPGGTGMDLLETVKANAPDVEVVLMTAFSSIETAVEAMRKGAYNYLPKPFSKDELLLTLAQVRDKIHLRQENRHRLGLVSERFSYQNMLGASFSMQEVYRTIEKVHSNSATVLIRGESGTGKELVARAVHASGNRKDKPFVPINCAAIPETLIESELFGHEKGAFTGALTHKVGRFEEVKDGTLFLDEIGSMQYELQAKLLRVIQEREFQRIGGGRTLRFQGRIVAATSQNLEALMEANRFRQDLYFRLNVVPIELPPLRERAGDLPTLASHFLKNYAAELEKETRYFAPEVLDLLEEYTWPGNVRELENVVQRMVVLADDSADVLDVDEIPRGILEHFPSQSGSPIVGDVNRRKVEVREALTSGLDRDGEGSETAGSKGDVWGRDGESGSGGPFRLPARGVQLADVEADLIRQALDKTQGRLEPAARLLGITYKTLQYRIKKYELKNE